MKMDLNSINKLLNNKDNCYHGHGTNGDRNKINSIMNKGIRCSHDTMYFTTDPIGIGGDIDFDKLNNWPFLKADYIIVVSNPIRFNILELSELYTYQKGFDAFCYDYEGDEVLSQGKYVLPELIVGCYNVKEKTFEKNNRYYELLSEEEQKKVIDTIKKNYAQTIEDACGLETYKEVLKELPEWEFPLTDEECESLIKNDSTPRMYI
ncbi:MAG: hypothetical protein E7174_03900 [Firmicutes bacterium]|nr:hypothetical protein [Bacillota bacterium]